VDVKKKGSRNHEHPRERAAGEVQGKGKYLATREPKPCVRLEKKKEVRVEPTSGREWLQKKQRKKTTNRKWKEKKVMILNGT